MKEHVINWNPQLNLPVQYFTDEIQQTKNHVSVLCSVADDRSQKFQLFFDLSTVVFYRETNESFWISLDAPTIDSRGKSVLIIENSKLVQSLCNELANTDETKKYKHFMLIDIELFLEIVATEDPQIKLCNDVK